MGFKRILIANRGEIALRILRSCRELGIEAAIIHGREDRTSLPVQLSDYAIPIYRKEPLSSYLEIDAVIDAAKSLEVDAVHPGYGFLAENAWFVSRLEQENITFIGPNSEVISLLGDKIRARAAMKEAGLPVAEGSDEPIKNANEAAELAEKIGYPVIIKAAAGGGGIGMQVVNQKSDFESALNLCQSRAQSAFGDNRVFVEKFIEGAQHIEFQVLADGKNAIHFGERFCSIQRRHQKIIEEGPWLSDEEREKESIRLGSTGGIPNKTDMEKIRKSPEFKAAQESMKPESTGEKVNGFLKNFPAQSVIRYGQMGGKASGIELNPSPNGDPTIGFAISDPKTQKTTKYTYPANKEVIQELSQDPDDPETSDESLGRKKFNYLLGLAGRGEKGIGERTKKEEYDTFVDTSKLEM